MTHQNKQTVNGLLYTNNNSGICQPGRIYQLPWKTKVTKVYLRLCEEQAHLSMNVAAKLSKVSWGFASLVVTELKAMGVVLDPKLK
jgi:hypothetical protein